MSWTNETNRTKGSFVAGFEKTAGLPKWLHDYCGSEAGKASVKGISKRGLVDMLKRRGIK